MIKIVKNFTEASIQTKIFLLTTLIFTAVLLVTTIFCYARLGIEPSEKRPASRFKAR